MSTTRPVFDRPNVLPVLFVFFFSAAAWAQTPTDTATSPPTATPPSYTVRINAGDGATVDSSQHAWSADLPYAPGGSGHVSGMAVTLEVPVAGSVDDWLYDTFRQGPAVEYRFDLPDPRGVFVTVKFVETVFHQPGMRVFDVLAEGATVLGGVDVYQAVGGSRAYDRTFLVNVTDGALNLLFQGVTGDALVCAIEVVGMSSLLPDTPTPDRTFSPTVTPTPTPTHTLTVTATPTSTPTPTPTGTFFTPTPTPFEARLNAGGGDHLDGGGRTWFADRAYAPGGFGWVSGGNSVTCAVPISGTSDESLYQTYRTGDMTYRFDVPTAQVYRVTLKFAETHFTEAGKRLFSAAASGVTGIVGLDVFSQAGPNAAYDVSFTVNVEDGHLDLVLFGAPDPPLLCAVEVVSAGPLFTPTATPTRQGGSSVPDLDVTYISRLPRYYRYEIDLTPVDSMGNHSRLTAANLGLKRWPTPGEAVTYVAHVLNKGQAPAAGYTGVWSVDSTPVATEAVSSALGPAALDRPDPETTHVLPVTWLDRPQTVEFAITPAAGEGITFNNRRTTGSHDLSLSIWVETGMYERFNGRQNLTGSYSCEDWVQNQYDRMNGILRDSVYDASAPYPGTDLAPGGITARVRVDKFVVEDEIDSLGGPLFTDPDIVLTDGRWVFTDGDPTNANGSGGMYQRFVDEYTDPGNPNQGVNGGVIHETAHQLGVVDLYMMQPSYDRKCNGGLQVTDPVLKAVIPLWAALPDGQPYLYPCGGIMSGGDIRPHPCGGGFFESHTAKGLNVNHPDPGTRPPYRRGYFGDYLYDTPSQTFLQAVNPQGTPIALAGAAVSLYQNVDNLIDATPEITVVLDASGRAILPNRAVTPIPTFATLHSLKPNPFGQIVQTAAGGFLFVKTSYNGQESYSWLTVHDLNLGCWQNAGGAYDHPLTFDPRTTPFITPTPDTGHYAARLDAGSCPQATVKDLSGNLWTADRPYSSGSYGYLDAPPNQVSGPRMTDEEIAGTSDSLLYEDCRWGMRFEYVFDLPAAAGNYQVTLKFAETLFWGPGQRRFHVVCQGVTQLCDFDVFQEAGGSNRAVDRVFTVTASGQLRVLFVGTLEAAHVAGIEVMGLDPLPTPTETFSNTPTATPTQWVTATSTSTPTQSPTLEPSVTADGTATSSPTPTPSPTSTPDWRGFPPVIFVPNPAVGDTVELFGRLDRDAKLLIVRLYTVASRRVRKIDVQDVPAGYYRLAVDLRDEKGKRLGNGVYFAVVEADNGERHIGKLVVLR